MRIWVSGGGRNGDWLDVSFEDSGGAGMAGGSKRLGSCRTRMARGLTLRWARMGWMRANGSLEANFCLGIHGWLAGKMKGDERESEGKEKIYSRERELGCWLVELVIAGGGGGGGWGWSGANKGKGAASDRFLFFQLPGQPLSPQPRVPDARENRSCLRTGLLHR